MYRLRFLRENLIVDDNPEITKTWTLLQDSTLPHSYAYRGQKGDNYGTTKITSIHAYIMVLSEHFETLNPISLNGYYEAQSSYITSSHLHNTTTHIRQNMVVRHCYLLFLFYGVGGYLY